MTTPPSDLTNLPRVTFFGATGGCTLAALARALVAGVPSAALARTPEKLTKALQGQNVPQSAIDAHLVIIQGDVKDEAAVRKALTSAPRASAPNAAPDLIISGVGSVPTLRASLVQPIGAVDPTLTADAAHTIIAALRSLPTTSPKKPQLCVISTTGISANQRDVPLALVPLYHWLLAAAHADKRNMEQAAIQERARANSTLEGVVIVRPTLLVDSAGKGLDAIREGWEHADSSLPQAHDAPSPGPALGYKISRDDVGCWIFERLVRNPDRGQWSNRAVSLTA